MWLYLCDGILGLYFCTYLPIDDRFWLYPDQIVFHGKLVRYQNENELKYDPNVPRINMEPFSIGAPMWYSEILSVLVH
jgi:hypothetical protein